MMEGCVGLCALQEDVMVLRWLDGRLVSMRERERDSSAACLDGAWC